MRSRSSRFFQVLVTFGIGAVVLIALMRFGGGDGTPPPAWAQVTSCGNGFLDPGEQCDPPGSITCPPGSPAGAFMPCNGDCTCPTAPSSCGNGFLDPGEQCDPPGSLTCPSGITGGGNVPCNPNCTCPPPCSPTPENTSPACSDTIDNDCDGFVDCADSDCTGTQPCPPARKDPTIITFFPGLDTLRGHAKLAMAPMDLTTEPVGILLTQPGTTIYSGTLPAGALAPNAKGTSVAYSNVAARTNGGVYSVKIKQNRDGSYTFRFKSYADLSAATDAHMRLQFYIGNDPNTAGDGRLFITSDLPWRQTPHGWRAPKDH